MKEITRERLLIVLLAVGISLVRWGGRPLTPPTLERLLTEYDRIASRLESQKLASPSNTISHASRELIQASLIARNRTLFCDKSGRLGLGPGWVDMGDEIIIVEGSAVPLCVRATGTPGEYWLVGTAYVEDVMYGEAWTRTENEHDECDECDEFILLIG